MSLDEMEGHLNIPLYCDDFPNVSFDILSAGDILRTSNELTLHHRDAKQ